MKLSDEDRRALAIILGLLVLASAARWLERARPLLDELAALDVAALEAASREARPEARPALRPGDRIDINTASPQELQRLPGVGPAMAQRLVEEREREPFRSLTELQRVRGIGPALAERLAEHVTLPAAGAGGGGPGQGSARVVLNRATAAELQAVQGIGPALAARLVARRDSLGGFRDWADVDAVPGVGPAMLARLQAQAVLH
jgi:competence ComEA-like helix-hairpin-helix protein